MICNYFVAFPQIASACTARKSADGTEHELDFIDDDGDDSEDEEDNEG